MNHRTGKCFPSLATLAADTGFSEDTVRRHLQALVVAGLIDIERTEGGSNDYLLHLDAGTPPAKYGGGHPPQNATPPLAKSPPPPSQNTGGDPPQNATLTREGDNQGREPGKVLDPTTCSSPAQSHRAKPRAAREPDPPASLFGEPPAAATAVVVAFPPGGVPAIPDPPTGGFEIFWSLYPRKIGKGGARTSWKAAVKKASPGVIIEALRARLPFFSEEARYVAHASTWLNQERWADEIASLERVQRATPMSAAEQSARAAGVTQDDLDAFLNPTRSKAQ